MEEKLMYIGRSAYQGIGGIDLACTLIRAGSYYLLNDCGISLVYIPEKERKPWQNAIESVGPDRTLLESFLNGGRIHAAIASHSHLDHIGAFPMVEDLFAPDAKILAAPQTSGVARIVFDDTISHSPYLYDIFQKERTLDRFRALPLGEAEILPGLRIFSGSAGHNPGACYTVIIMPSGKQVLLTNDWCKHDQPIVGGSSLADDLPDEFLPDVIGVTDFTSPKATPVDYEFKMQKLAGIVSESLAEGKFVCELALGNGRGQNVAVDQVKRGISPIYVDGQIREIFHIFAENRWSPKDREISFDGIRFVSTKDRGHRTRLMHLGGPRVVVTTAGMGDFGPAEAYLWYGLRREDWVFIFTSWLAPTSRGARLLEKRGKPNASITMLNPYTGEPELVPIRARIEAVHPTAHCTLSDNIALMQKIVERRGKPLELICVTHSDADGKAIAVQALHPFARSVIPVSSGTIVDLQNF